MNNTTIHRGLQRAARRTPATDAKPSLGQNAYPMFDNCAVGSRRKSLITNDWAAHFPKHIVTIY
jgi:hypothetical protein